VLARPARTSFLPSQSFQAKTDCRHSSTDKTSFISSHSYPDHFFFFTIAPLHFFYYCTIAPGFFFYLITRCNKKIENFLTTLTTLWLFFDNFLIISVQLFDNFLATFLTAFWKSAWFFWKSTWAFWKSTWLARPARTSVLPCQSFQAKTDCRHSKSFK
jgi:hypothetical protein